MDIAHRFGYRVDAPEASDPRNFSIVLGGPLYQLLRRAHFSGDALEMVRRRILVMAAIAWLPLLVLALIEGNAIGGPAVVPFLMDFEVHVRLLVAMPLLVGAELLVHLRLRPVAQQFIERRLVPEESLERYRESLRSAFRLRNSISAELLIVALVYVVGIPFVWQHFAAMNVPTWQSLPASDGTRMTLAGLWYTYLSVPLFQFLLLRWYFRMAIWARFLWQTSRLELAVSALHPDRRAGLGFLSNTVFAFVPLLMAHGALVAGNLANRILHEGGTLMAARFEIAGIVFYILVLVCAPLLVFAPCIAAAKRRASREYATFAQRYVSEFRAKWLEGGNDAQRSALGEADIQSLADLDGAFAAVRETRPIPVSRDAVVQLALATLVPMAPLLLTVIPAEELLTRLVKLIL
jgi:hypothetical protein